MSLSLASPFPLRDVELLDGVQSRTRDQMLHLAREFPVDRLLAVFRANAGLDTRGAQPPGTWEDFGHPDEQPWSAADYPGAGVAPTASLLRGHYAGHFLSMLSLAYGSTSDVVFRDKAYAFVEGLAEVQSALAATGRYSHPGFLAAYGEWQFSRLEDFAPYGEIWAPWYTTHKIMAGLLDAYLLTGSALALEVVTAMGHWVAGRMLPLDRARVQKMWSLYIAGEYGGMNETMTTLYNVTGISDFLATAATFEMDGLLDAAVAGRDVLDGMHANQHLPMLVGHLEQYEATGDRRYLDAVLALWDQLVPGRMFAHGGTGEGELWGPAGTVAGFIKRRNAETCATYNLLKIARRLFGLTLDPRFGEYIERASLNHIVGSRADVTSDVSPEVLYMFPVDAGAIREYDNVGTCCGGTGLESHVKHQESVWFHSSSGDLYLLHIVPTRLRFGDGSITVRTGYPRSAAVSIDFDCSFAGQLHVRIGSVFRTFRPAGGRVSFEVPMPLRLVPTVDDPTLVSVELGPTVLLARSDATTTLSIAPAAHRQLDGSLTGFTTDGDLISVLGLDFEPAWSGGSSRYHMYLRVADSHIAFPGSATDVPDRPDAAGWSFLTGLWSTSYADFGSFFAAVLAHAVRAARAGLLSRDEALAVVTAASTSSLRAGATLDPWSLPADIGAGDPLPVVRLDVAGERAASGWYTASPSFTVTSLSPATLAFGVDGGEWQPVAAPVTLDEGRHVLRARATDLSGRIVHTTREVAVDTSPPTVRAKIRALGPTNVEVTLYADDEVSGVDRIQWRTPETFWGVFQEAFIRALRDEPQTLEFTATDRAGNTTAIHQVVLPPL